MNKDFKEFAELLNFTRVEYLIVGGYVLPRIDTTWIKDRKIYRARKAHRLVKCPGMSGYGVSNSRTMPKELKKAA